jgi:hypothetical protein
MAVISVATITVAPGRWDEFIEGSKKAKTMLEKHGAKNVRLLAELAGAVGSTAVHSTFEADDLAALGKVMDSIYADPDMLALMQNGTAVSWTSSILGEIPLS